MPTSTATIASTTDDGRFAYYRGSDTFGFSNSLASLTIGGFEGDDDDTPAYYSVFLRFTGTLPSQGDTLNTATLNLTAASNTVGLNVRIYGCSSIAPSAPTNNSMGYELGRTSNYVSVSSGSSNNTLEQYDVTSIVQEMLDDPDFDGGEIMIIIDEDMSDANTGLRSYHSSGASTSSYRPTLSLDWSSGGGTTSTSLRRRLTLDQDTGGAITSNALSAYDFVTSFGGITNPTITSGSLLIQKYSGDDDDDPEDRRVYLRFAGNASSQLAGATISSATLYCNVSSSQYTAGYAKVYGHAAASPDMPATVGGLPLLPQTTNSADLPVSGNVSIGANSYEYTERLSLDVTSVVQEAVNVSSYDGSAVMLILRGTQAWGGSSAGSYTLLNPSAGNELYLDVEFTTSSTSISAESDDVQSSSQASQVDVTAVSVVDTIVVTVSSATNSYGTGNKYLLDAEASRGLEKSIRSGTGRYRFDLSDSSLSGHPLAFSETPNGTHAGGTKYTTGYSLVGTPGSPGAYADLDVSINSTPHLYYYCENHSGMGSDPWTGQNFPLSGTAANAFGWYAFSEASTQPRTFFNTYNYLGYDGSFADPSLIFAEKKMPLAGTLDYNYQAAGSSSYIRVYKNGTLDTTHNNSTSGSSSIEVSAGDVIRFTFENSTSAVGIRGLSLTASATAEAAGEDIQSASQCSEVLLYKTRPVTRTAHFW